MRRLASAKGPLLRGSADMTTLYAVVFIGVFPALWILARVFDHIMPDNSGQLSPKETDGNREPLL